MIQTLKKKSKTHNKMTNFIKSLAKMTMKIENIKVSNLK